MTDREKAIVMAYTGICMLSGKNINEFYKYLSELYGRPVYTHEIVTLDIKGQSKDDFVELCRKEESERKTGMWIDMGDHVMCSCCGATHYGADKNFCPNCGAKMEN